MILKIDAKFKEKLTCSLEHDLKKLGEFSTNHSKVWKIRFDGLFLSKVQSFEIKKYRGVIFHDPEQWYKI